MTVEYDTAAQQLKDLQQVLGQSIVGHDDLLRDLITAIFAGGSVLLEGLPGLGKTRLTQCTAAALGLDMSRIQCTPDLMPADITGSESLSVNGQQQLEFRPGPVFSNLVLVDEINRASPRTQSALLEAMQEQQVTYLGQTHPLPKPFWLLATQNPIELEGTYPLPEAQLDRFLFKLQVGMPDAAGLGKILDLTLQNNDSTLPEQLLDVEQQKQLSALAVAVVIAEPVRAAAIALIRATQPKHSEAARKHLRYGASPRGLQAVARAAQVRALQNGRAHVSTSDLTDVAIPALQHRVILSVESEIAGLSTVDTLGEIIEQWQSSLG